jgi:hypothetical protein
MLVWLRSADDDDARRDDDDDDDDSAVVVRAACEEKEREDSMAHGGDDVEVRADETDERRNCVPAAAGVALRASAARSGCDNICRPCMNERVHMRETTVVMCTVSLGA